MGRYQIIIRTALALLAFAGNSLLCRQALRATSIDAASFTSIRLFSAAVTLAVLVYATQGIRPKAGNWRSAAALFAYAAAFSLAYVNLTAATGALLLFGAVQLTMIGMALLRGESLQPPQMLGLFLACAGLIWLLLPGLSAPPLASALLMIGAGVAWGFYSLLGRGAVNPLLATAGNFLRTLPMTAAFSLLMLGQARLDRTGALLAVASGAVTSGIGYSIWYSVLPQLRSTQAATLQLAVPVITAIAAILFMGDSLSLRLVTAGIAILAGIALVIRKP